MTPFEIATASLEPGVVLIEASAGTGKTHSITGLVLRFILEQHLPIRQILAVTFTEAATEELRDRVRQRLQGALDDLRSGTTQDEIVQAFLKRGDIPCGIRDLDLALQSFDEAQIFTIHGFCQRMLSDHAFESGARFETALQIDPNPLFLEVARDYWRLRFYEANPLLPALALAWEKSPDNWVELLEQTRRHPDLAVIPGGESKSCDELLADAEAAFRAVAAEWKELQREIERLLRTSPGLSRSEDHFREDRVDVLLVKITEACERLGNAAPENIRAIEAVSTEAITAGTKKTGVAPVHSFFDRSTTFCQSVEALFNQLTHDFLAFAEVELPKRKAKTNTVTYDDLITGLRDALRHEKKGGVLAHSIGEKYAVALIDEFQDTDPAQYEIFRTIFEAGHHRLFFIGDPKQAIYGFRGADVFTYFEAAETATRKFTLVTNWRAEDALLAAINAIFAQTDDPFLLPGIQYHPVHAPSDPKVDRLIGKDRDRSLNFRLLRSSDDQENGKESASASKLISRSVSNDIAALRASGAFLGERPLRFGDMAVLVRRYGQAEEVQSALRARGIRSVVQSDQSVFASLEARELQQFLQGVIDPRRDPLLKAALATTLIGFDAHDLFEFDRDDQKRQAWLDRFSRWKQQWTDGCFMALFRDLAVSQNIRARIIELPAGERRLTNYLHLAELLHEVESERSLTPDALCSWFREQRESERVSQDRFLLRLESDEDAVQIVTIHKSKGLEYPIVFCPFLWQKAEMSSQQELLFHNRAFGNRLTFDLRGKKAGAAQHREWQSQETIAEEFRLLYVAVTRAKNRCYIYLPERIQKSPLARLIQAPRNSSVADHASALASSCESCHASEAEPGFRQDALRQIERETTAALTPKSRAFTANIPKAAMTTSFSGLNITEAEFDEIGANPVQPEVVESGYSVVSPIPPSQDPSDLSIFTFDRGRRTGDFFHAVLQHLDFQNLEGIADLVESRLGVHGFARTAHRPAITQILRQLAEVELDPGLTLRDIPKQERLAECEFCYPLAHLTPALLAKCIGRWGTIAADIRTRMGKLRFDPVEGFMRGFIDLLFRFNGRYYLIDWKSNWLGSQAADYGLEGMRRAMLTHNYYLQYHLYTLAADLFLERRVPDYSYETHFGGVFYVFLRGIDPADPSRGIFRDRPAVATARSLRALIA